MVRLTKIYTRTGDAGTTGLVGGGRTRKDSLRIAAIGEVDEANSALGVAIAAQPSPDLARIQHDLFDLGADLATPAADGDFAPADTVLRIVPAQVTWLEREIDRLNAPLAPLTSFVLPGGAAAAVHVARAIVRRAERAAVALGRAEPVNPAALAYLNRLSDYLFVLARTVNQSAGGDVLWVPGRSR